MTGWCGWRKRHCGLGMTSEKGAIWSLLPHYELVPCSMSRLFRRCPPRVEEVGWDWQSAEMSLEFDPAWMVERPEG